MRYSSEAKQKIFLKMYYFAIKAKVYNYKYLIEFRGGERVIKNKINLTFQSSFVLTVCDQMAIGVFLFFGSKDSKSAETIESFTRKFHVPYVCPCLTKVVDPKNNFQIHMKPPFTMAIVDMIRHYRWRNMIYLYDSTEGKYIGN